MKNLAYSQNYPEKIYQNAGDFNVDWTQKHPHVEVLDTTFSYLEGANLIGVDLRKAQKGVSGQKITPMYPTQTDNTEDEPKLNKY